MTNDQIGPSLLAALARVPDVRSHHGRCYPLSALLTLATAAMLAGARSLYAIAQWGRMQPPEVRRAQAKKDTGSVQVNFHKTTEGYELVFEDDGAGIAPEALKAAAVRRQLISEDDAALMDNRAAMALIFRPGFSTQEEVSMDAGRGVGMDVVARSVYALGGKIGVSTNPGKFTRFKIVLPAAEAANSGAAVAV